MISEPLETLLHQLDHILRLQPLIPGLLTGLYLDSTRLGFLAEKLSSEDPVPNSAGRYCRIPVYDHAFLRVALQKPHGEHEGIIYTYVPMLAVDCW
jgi:hypothetical protein